MQEIIDLLSNSDHYAKRASKIDVPAYRDLINYKYESLQYESAYRLLRMQRSDLTPSEAFMLLYHYVDFYDNSWFEHGPRFLDENNIKNNWLPEYIECSLCQSITIEEYLAKHAFDAEQDLFNFVDHSTTTCMLLVDFWNSRALFFATENEYVYYNWWTSA